MKVGGTGAASGAGATSRSARPAAGGFAPQSGGSVRETAATGAMGGVAALGSLDALLALQETPGPLERRRRAVRRANQLLDSLDQIKLAMLDGAADPRSALEQLRTLSRDARDGTEDLGLESLLDEVDLRTEVELAKDEMARKAWPKGADNSPRVEPGAQSVISPSRYLGA
jgi:hypothetical protein